MPVATSAKRIHTTTSRTAEFTCMSRAASSFETEPHYHGGDGIAPLLVPGLVRTLLRAPVGRAAFRRLLAPRGLYEYVIARTKYIDTAFAQALNDRVAQIVLFGAGFDTRAVRFERDLGSARVFELDVLLTQAAKIARYRELGLTLPPNLAFVAIDFERDSIAEKLAASGFRAGGRSLFILEGVLMYLAPDAVDRTFRSLRALAGAGSRLVFDYVRTSMLAGEAAQAVAEVNESWQFGLEPERLADFLSAYGFTVTDHLDPAALERLYFTQPDGRVAGRVNLTHRIVTAAQ
jgi:methyltransferase (TIGR00027 family)